MPELPGQCPFCKGSIVVTGFKCEDCGAAVGGEFSPNRLSGLGAEQADFALTFIRSRGNIRELERELGISYPTVRARLDDVIRALGFRVKEDAAAVESARLRRNEILAAVERGEMDALTAANALKQL